MARPRRALAWLGYALAWLAAAVPFTVALAVLSEHSVRYTAPWAILAMGDAAALGIGVWFLTGRVPWPDPRWARFAAVHIAAACVYAALFSLGLFAPEAIQSGPATALHLLRWSPERGWIYLCGLWLYAIVAAVSYAIRVGRRLREREVAAARTETLAARAQLAALRAQLNPHFLFNSLHSLTTLLRHDAAAAEAAVDRLGDLLRYALDGATNDCVTLAEEWEFTRNYLALEELRLGPRLKVVTQLDPDALDAEVPSFLLQPLVENAIRHGIAVRPEGGTVTIRAEPASDGVIVAVSDDGPGAAPDRLAAGPGLGLRALRQRLEAYYRGGASLAVTTAPGAGFSVSVRLPARMTAPAAGAHA